jgi:hypothetical protein
MRRHLKSPAAQAEAAFQSARQKALFSDRNMAVGCS